MGLVPNDEFLLLPGVGQEDVALEGQDPDRVEEVIAHVCVHYLCVADQQMIDQLKVDGVVLRMDHKLFFAAFQVGLGRRLLQLP